MRDKGQVDAHTEHLQRLLATFDQGTKNRPTEDGRVARNEVNHQHDQCRQVQYTIGRKIGLVVWDKDVPKRIGK
jgi:hypothetical protein